MPTTLSDFFFVRLTGLEPARRETPDPKSGASTNSATGACRRIVLVNAGAKIIILFHLAIIFLHFLERICSQCREMNIFSRWLVPLFLRVMMQNLTMAGAVVSPRDDAKKRLPVMGSRSCYYYSENFFFLCLVFGY